VKVVLHYDCGAWLEARLAELVARAADCGGEVLEVPRSVALALVGVTLRGAPGLIGGVLGLIAHGLGSFVKLLARGIGFSLDLVLGRHRKVSRTIA